ncbi:MAG: hypothetical protein ABFS12_03195 [Bacteroidota bacterium]
MYQFLKLIKGQSKVVNILEKIVSSKQIPHAFLFTGPRNVGQHFTAKQLLKSIIVDADSDKSIEQKIDKLEDPYIKYVIPLPRGKGESSDDLPYSKISSNDLEVIALEIREKSDNPYHEIIIDNANNIKINSIRDIKKNLSINYTDLFYRMIIIEDAHLMSKEAQNALLKSLEEPPEGIIFVLITHKQEFLLPTIISRCWELKFTSLSNEIIEEILITKFNIEKSIAEEVSPFANGSIHNALELLNYGFHDLVETSINILRYSLARWYNTSLRIIQDEIDKNSKNVLPIILTLLISWFNDAEKYRNGIEKFHFANHIDTIKKFNTKFEDVDISKIVFDLNNLKDKLDLNINLNIIALNIIFRIASIGIR